MAALLDLQTNRKLIDCNFESYRLSLDPLPILKQNLHGVVECADLTEDQYGFLHAHLASLVNHLFQDPWAENSVFFVTESRHICWTCLLQDGRLTEPKTVWRLPHNSSALPSSNVTVSFACQEWSVVTDGRGHIYIINTPSRGEGEPWQVCHTYTVEDCSSSCIVLHSIYHTFPSMHQVDCLLAHISKAKDIKGGEKLGDYSNVHFVCILEWLTFSCVNGSDTASWSLKRHRQLIGPSVPMYAAFERTGEAVVLISEKPFLFAHDSQKEIRKEVEVTSSPPTPPLYTYIQTKDDVTIFFSLGEGMTAQDIAVEIKPSHLEMRVRDKPILSGPTWGIVSAEESMWTVQDKSLEILLTKAEKGQMWKEVVKGDDQGQETLDQTLVEEIHSRLAHLTSETEATYDGKPTYNDQQLEDCDISMETTLLQRLDGEQHSATHQVNMGGHQWLFTSLRSPDLLPVFCLRHDVDGLVWQPKNVMSDGEPELFKLEHVATFPALGYVLASKQSRKFVTGSPDFSFAAVSDASRHVYIYRQPKMLGETLELRNRKTGQEVSHIANQHVVNVEQCDDILGLRVSNHCIFVLGKKAIFAVKVHES